LKRRPFLPTQFLAFSPKSKTLTIFSDLNLEIPYFYRSAILKNFSPLALRNDTGALWENFLLAERMKRKAYADYSCNAYFWRTTSQQKIYYVEDVNGKLQAFEFKGQQKKNARFPA
jgi:uncharacterized protein